MAIEAAGVARAEIGRVTRLIREPAELQVVAGGLLAGSSGDRQYVKSLRQVCAAVAVTS